MALDWPDLTVRQVAKPLKLTYRTVCDTSQRLLDPFPLEEQIECSCWALCCAGNLAPKQMKLPLAPLLIAVSFVLAPDFRRSTEHSSCTKPVLSAGVVSGGANWCH